MIWVSGRLRPGDNWKPQCQERKVRMNSRVGKERGREDGIEYKGGHGSTSERKQE